MWVASVLWSLEGLSLGGSSVGLRAGSKTSEPRYAMICCNAIYWNHLEHPAISLTKEWCQCLCAKRKHFSGQRAETCQDVLETCRAFQLPSLTLLKGILSWADRLTQIQQHQQGGLSGSLPWQPLHLLPPLLLEVKNQVFCLIRPRTHLLRVFSPVIKLFGSRMYHLNPFCSEKWG